MRRPRLKAPKDFATACYHCVSRVVNRERVLGDDEKEEFVRLMRVYERLYGVTVLTFCVMGNHFHILVEVPSRPEVLPADAELVALVRETKGKEEAFNLGEWLKKWRKEGNDAAAEAERERYFRRMWDVSEFMKVLKQRFSQWFNGRHKRKGTLWEDRFRSVLVERGDALWAMAAYIDLNPIRAGIVNDPKDYRWCGYGEAGAGKKAARAGLLAAARATDPLFAAKGLLEWYRTQLFGRGEEQFGENGQVQRRGFNRKKALQVIESGGRLSRPEFLRLRVRYFTDGAVIGSQTFIEGIFSQRRRWFSPLRQTGARRLRGLARDDSLRTMRALVIAPVG